MTPKEIVQKESEILISQTQESIGHVKKIAIGEAWKLLQLATASIVQVIEHTANDLAGSDKKTLALSCLNSFYDRVFIVIDIPFVPQLIEPIIHRYVKGILMIMVAASIDATVTIFRNTGVFIKKGFNKEEKNELNTNF
jgi:hypothetical protein